MKWTPLAVPPCALAESPRYAHGGWFWVDISGRTLYRLEQNDVFDIKPSQLRATTLPDEMGCVLPTAKSDTLIGLGRQGAWLLHGDDATLKLPAPFDSSLHRFNDGRADSQGRIWISSLVDARQPATAALYRIENMRIHEQVSGLIVGNGLAFSPKGDCMFLSDTRQRCIWRYEYKPETGELGARKLVKQYTDGTARPDGACFSQDGSYWVAVLEGYRLDRFSATGDFIDSVPLPLAKPTMPCFGGENGNTLLVCAAQADTNFPNLPGFEQCSVIACNTRYTGMAEAFANPAHLQ